MKLNVISDLHCEINRDGSVNWLDFEPERLMPADYLVVAGDTGYAMTEPKIIDELKKKTDGKFKQILTIKGNHSYWVPYEFDNKDDEDKFGHEMIPNDTIDLVDGDIAIIGTTLWTNAVSYNEAVCMNDYRRTPDFNPAKKLKRYGAESTWLRERYNHYKGRGKRIVVVTHHNPRNSIILPEYSREHEDVHSAYWVYEAAEDWPDWETEIEKMSFDHFNKGLIKDVNDLKPDVWVCGHIHEDLDIEHEGTRFVRHPIGYRWGYYSVRYLPDEIRQNRINSWYDCVVEI